MLLAGFFLMLQSCSYLGLAPQTTKSLDRKLGDWLGGDVPPDSISYVVEFRGTPGSECGEFGAGRYEFRRFVTVDGDTINQFWIIMPKED